MADSRLHELKSAWEATGELSVKLQLLRLQIRSGALSSAVLTFAAALGDAGARQALGEAGGALEAVDLERAVELLDARMDEIVREGRSCLPLARAATEAALDAIDLEAAPAGIARAANAGRHTLRQLDAGEDPSGVLRVLLDLRGGSISISNSLASSAPPSALAAALDALVDAISSSQRPRYVVKAIRRSSYALEEALQDPRLAEERLLAALRGAVQGWLLP